MSSNKIKLDKVYRIRTKIETNSYTYEKNFVYIIERRVKFLFFSFWVKEVSSFPNQGKAENYLEEYLKTKHFVKYYCIISDLSVFDGKSLSELEKKIKLKAFL